MAKANKKQPTKQIAPQTMAIGCVIVFLIFLFALNTLINFFVTPLLKNLPLP
jgi:cytochrome c-type biogenesis protein CcmE